MKKDYVKPTVSVRKLNYEGVLCGSIEEGETDKIGVSDKTYTGDGLYADFILVKRGGDAGL